MTENDGCRLGQLKMEEEGGKGRPLCEYLKGGLTMKPSFILHGR